MLQLIKAELEKEQLEAEIRNEVAAEMQVGVVTATACSAFLSTFGLSELNRDCRRVPLCAVHAQLILPALAAFVNHSCVLIVLCCVPCNLQEMLDAAAAEHKSAADAAAQELTAAQQEATAHREQVRRPVQHASIGMLGLFDT